MKIGINGFGRIGRSVFRILQERDDIEVVGINDITDAEVLAYLLRHDSVMGNFPGKAYIEDGHLVTDKGAVRISTERDPAALPWQELGVDFAIEATGVFRTREQVAKHMEAGARKVILTVPAKDEIDATVVLGVNNEDLKPEHQVVSNASCTTNCLAPPTKVLHEEFKIQKAFMTTIHAYTGDQRILDAPHKDLRRARAAAVSQIPTTTGAAKAVGLVIPELKGKIDGFAMRVPTPNVSVVDLVALLEKDTTAEEVNAALKGAARGKLKGILDYSEIPLVSVDFMANPHSSIVDGLFTRVIEGNLVKILSWYDNEWGYSCRLVDLVKYISR